MFFRSFALHFKCAGTKNYISYAHNVLKNFKNEGNQRPVCSLTDKPMIPNGIEERLRGYTLQGGIFPVRHYQRRFNPARFNCAIFGRSRHFLQRRVDTRRNTEPFTVVLRIGAPLPEQNARGAPLHPGRSPECRHYDTPERHRADDRPPRYQYDPRR